MSISIFSALNQPNFGSLVTLICHLTIGGDFRTAHLFYDSETMDSRTFGNIKCSDRISWIINDVNSEVLVLDYEGRKHQTIQLIFFNLKAMDKFKNLEKYSVYHRLFIYLHDDSKIVDLRKIFEYGKEEINSTQGSLLLIYDIESQKTKVHLFTQTIDEPPIHVESKNASQSTSVALFNQLYGKFDEMWLTGVGTVSMHCVSPDAWKKTPYLIMERSWMHFYFDEMKLDFSHVINMDCRSRSDIHSNSYVNKVTNPIYTTSSIKKKSNDNLMMSKMISNDTPTVELIFLHFVASAGMTNRTRIIELYPYRKWIVEVSFFYGKDYEPRLRSATLFEVVSGYWFIPLWFLVATALLYLIRSKTQTKERAQDISSTFMDMMIIFFGGGNLIVSFKVERYFIGILLIGMFLIQSIWTGDFLSKMSNSRNVNSVRTFEKLSELKTPVYIGRSLNTEQERVAEILKYVLTFSRFSI